MRDEFLVQVTKVLAARSGHVCSNPLCLAPTSGPSSTEDKAVSVGVASHITAAAPGGPRYDASLTSDQRSGVDNGIWLCRICGTLIDADPSRFPVALLRQWKTDAEQRATSALGRPAATPLATQSAADKALFVNFQRALPFTGAIRFIDENNLAGFAFESHRLTDLEAFARDWGDAAHEFIDPKLEQLRARLHSLAQSYLAFLYRNTWTTDAGWRTVPPEWEVEQPERFEQVVDTLHTLAGAIVNAHQDLVRAGRHRLDV